MVSCATAGDCLDGMWWGKEGRRQRPCQMWMGSAAGWVVVFFLLVTSCPQSAVSTCANNPVSDTQCSMELSFMKDIGGAGSVLVSAGLCDAGINACRCNHPFKGASCSTLAAASSPPSFSIERSKQIYKQKLAAEQKKLASGTDTSPMMQDPSNSAYRMVDGKIFSSWTFLAKSCWNSEAKGSIRVQLEYVSINCSTGGVVDACRLEDASKYDKNFSMPSLVFYSHFDASFEDAVLKTYFPTDKENPYCDGSGGVYKEELECTAWDGKTCIFDKTFQVSNRSPEPAKIFMAIAGCYQKGLVLWNVSVSSDVEEHSAVCGARGTVSYMRCYEEQGPTCQVQNPTLFSTTFVPVKNISKTTMAIVCAAFVAAVVFGLMVIKILQTRRKRAREREKLDQMTKMHYERNGLGPNGTGSRLPPQYLSPTGRLTAEAMTGHFPISGGGV